jgi:ERCC4-type nuclease
MRRNSWRLVLLMIPSLGNIVCENLMDRFETPENIFQTSLSTLMEVEGFREKTAKKFFKQRISNRPP